MIEPNDRWRYLVALARQEEAPATDVVQAVLARIHPYENAPVLDPLNGICIAVCSIVAVMSILLTWPAWTALWQPWMSLAEQFQVMIP